MTSTRDLRAAFPNTNVKGQRAEEFEEGTLLEELPDILVMTPEACLYASHIEPDSFADVGLLIFDECHLIHPKTDGDRRAVLCRSLPKHRDQGVSSLPE